MGTQPGADEAPRRFDELELAAIGDYLPELRRSLKDQRILRSYLVVAFAAGLAAHIGGYLLRSAALTEPFGLLADLLYAFGLALWTGVVVITFVQLFPESKRRQIIEAIDAYERWRRDRSSS